MPFDPSPISDLQAKSLTDRLVISWTSTAPAGSTYQAYQDRSLVWYGTETTCRLNLPSSRTWIDVGVVGSGESLTDFSGSLDSAPTTRATLTWKGGTYLDPTITSFQIFGSLAPGQPVSMTRLLATVPAYDAGIVTDGYGLGGYGEGGFGQSASTYTWTSEPLSPGVWSFAVQSVDQSGLTSMTATTTVTIAGPPNAPAPNPASNPPGQRLTYVYNLASRVVTLNWLAIPV